VWCWGPAGKGGWQGGAGDCDSEPPHPQHQQQLLPGDHHPQKTLNLRLWTCTPPSTLAPTPLRSTQYTVHSTVHRSHSIVHSTLHTAPQYTVCSTQQTVRLSDSMAPMLSLFLCVGFLCVVSLAGTCSCALQYTADSVTLQLNGPGAVPLWLGRLQVRLHVLLQRTTVAPRDKYHRLRLHLRRNGSAPSTPTPPIFPVLNAQGTVVFLWYSTRLMVWALYHDKACTVLQACSHCPNRCRGTVQCNTVLMVQ